MIRSLVSTIILAVFFLGCGGDGIGPESGTRVTIAFTAGSSAAQTSGAQAAPSMVSVGPGLAIPGDNGLLTLTEVWMIVAEFELEKASGSCMLGPGEHCHDFEAPPSFLELPLTGDIVEVVIDSEIPVGSYDELEFEVEDLDLDDEDDDEDDDFVAEFGALHTKILDRFSDWPDEASMLVVGTFQPDGGDITHFRVYLDAEIEIEIEFDEVLVIDTDTPPMSFTVDVHPELWFDLGNDVLDLSMFDWDETMELLEFEFEFENDHHGFEIEIEIG